MKKQLICIFLVFALGIGIMPDFAFVQATEESSQTEEYGTFVDGNKVISDMMNKNKANAHPRLIMTEDKFAKLRGREGELESPGKLTVTGELLRELRGEVNRYLGEAVSTYNDYDGNHLETAKKIQRRVAALALAYNIFEDDRYAERCYQELEAACGFKDWNPRHFLDPAEMCTAFAYGYDWLYNWMDDSKRKFLRKNMIEKGLNQIMEDYTDTPSNRDRTYKWYQDTVGDNWQLVCTGGTNLAALAIGDEDDAKDIAAEVLTYGYKRAYSFVRRAYSAMDGTYIEGLGYWDYATYYLGLQSSALKSATGTDYGLADYEGIRKSVDFVRYMSSNVPYSFSFGDDNDSRDTGWAVFLWLGEHFDSPELSAIRLKKIKPGQGHEFNYLDVLWIDESKQNNASNNNATDWGAVGASNASFRNTWDESGLVAALHVGENNYKYHGHYDLGSFYVESNGSRFFTDLGNENYSLENRKYSYRIKPEGHNTLVINPSENTDQLEGANCLITSFGSGNEAYAITDLTEAYEPNGAKSVIRGLKMIKDKECVIVQDDISLDAPGEIYWFAHTKGSVEIADDGRSAVVTVGSDKLWVGLISESGKFTVMEAEPLSSSLKVVGARDNSEYRKLAIHLTDTKNTTISVGCIPLKNGETSPSWLPSMESFSEWERTTEPTPTVTPVVIAEPTPTVTPVVTAEPTPTVTPVVTAEPMPAVTPVITAEPMPVIPPAVTPATTPVVKPTITPAVKPVVAPGIRPTTTPKSTPVSTIIPELGVVPEVEPDSPLVPSVVLKKHKIKTAKIKAVKVKKLKKKAVKIKIKAKTDGKGKLIYKIKKNSKKKKKYISVSKKGVVKLKKRAVKGIYKVTIIAKANGIYKKTIKVVKIKVK